MNSFFRIVLFISFFATSLSDAKPFKRALILAGGGLAPITYASIAKHIEDLGWKPDLIIATCGSSLSVNALMGHPNRNDLNEFFLSREFHDFMRIPEISLKSAFEVNKLISPVTSELNSTMFEKYILDAPDNVFMKNAPGKFPTQGTRYIIVAGKTLFGPQSNYEAMRVRFRETYFTDSKTAQYLRGRKSAIALQYPNSFIDRNVEVRTDISPMEAARASISDPVLMRPAFIDGDYYITGGINLYPIELAKDLADEVMVTYPLRFPQYMSDIVQETYGYSALDRQAHVSKQNVNWVDVHGKNNGFNPHLILFKLVEGVPSNYYLYKRTAKAEWNFGLERAREALNARQSGKQLSNIRKTVDKQNAKRNESNFKNPKKKYQHKR
ncbi:hypothetical protein GW915_07980 [bacterium]|nr:hypothetical protein [bacterium]